MEMVEPCQKIKLLNRLPVFRQYYSVTSFSHTIISGTLFCLHPKSLKPTPFQLIGTSGPLIWSKTLVELIFNSCGEFRRSPKDPVNQIYSPHVYVGASETFSDHLRPVQMLKREWGAESNGELPRL